MSGYMCKFAAFGAVGILLAGCGGGSVSFTPGPNGLPVAAAGLTANQAKFQELAGTKITTTGSRASYTLSGGSFSNTQGSVAAEVTYNANNTITLKLGADTFTLASSGTVFTDGTVTLVPGFSGAGADANSIYFFGISESNPGAGAFSETFLVTGFETPAADVAARTASQSYSGSASIVTQETAGSSITSRTVLDDDNGAMALTVNFGAVTPTVTGTISGALESDVGTGSVNLNLTGTVSGAGISGSIAQTGANATATGLTVSNGSFSGGFFGPGAEDIGGTFGVDLSGTQLSEPTTAAGFFIGRED